MTSVNVGVDGHSGERVDGEGEGVMGGGCGCWVGRVKKRIFESFRKTVDSD